jgi:phosphoheptose isomerase
MNNKSLAIGAIVAVAGMLVTSLVGTNVVFAGGYEKSQATAQITVAMVTCQ